ncbi:MAG TPA: glutamine-synthetase adenylyltransferase, partial [Stellaceae bacterium]|nr:glutamine-synthetase adenylyltransferase [Stellaceae bacterium]
MPAPFSSLPAFDALPPPADEAAASVGLARWREAADDATDTTLAAAMRTLATDAAGARLLSSVFGNSPYLTQTCLKEPGFVIRLAEQGLDATFAEILDGLNHEVGISAARPAVMTALRVAKRRAALTIALADLARQWELAQVTGALSDFAEQALSIVVHHLL